MYRNSHRILLRSTICAAALAAGLGMANGAAAQQQAPRQYTITQGNLHGALDQFSRQSGLQLLYSPDDVRSVPTAAVSGRMSPDRALRSLLRNTSLEYRYTDANTVVIVPRGRDEAGGGRPAPARQAAPAPAAPAVQAPANPTQLEEVIVTAERRSQSAQRVPMAITAFTGEALIQQGVENTADLQLRTPGFVMSANVAFGQPYLRGIGNSTLTIGSDSSVAVHLDGVYLTRPAAAFQDFFDIERVEVLKGPQGTLYGRNATGGVINIITADPSDTFTARGELTLGNYDKIRVAGTISGPLSDTVSGRLTAMSNQRSGYVHNLFDGGDLDDENLFAIRGSLLFEPSDNFDLLLSADNTRERSTRGHGLKSVITGAGSAGYTPPTEPHVVNKNHPAHTDLDMSGVSARARWDMDGVRLTSLTAWRSSAFDLGLDLDLSPNNHSYVDPETEDSDTFTQEFQLASTGEGRLEWLLGAFYLKEDADTLFNIVIVPSNINQRPNGFNETTAWAVFGQGSWWASDRLRLTVGGRYSDENKEGSVITNFPAPTRTDSGERSWDAFTPRFSVDFFPREGVMLYASATKGFKSGGFNATARGLPAFDPEEVWSYEAGLKSTFADGRMRANLSAFHYDYTNLQVRALVSGVISSVTNAAAATVQGFEGEFLYRPTEATTFNFGVSYLDAQFDDFPTTNPDIGTTPINLAGNRLPRAPRWQMMAGVEHDVALEGATLTLRGDWQYQGDTYFDEFNVASRMQEGFSTFSARATWAPDNAPWTVAVWGRNLTDEDYITNTLRSAGTYGTAHAYGAPRTYGVTLSVRY